MALALGVVALVAGPAMAQGRMGRGGGSGPGGILFLLQNKSVQKELGLEKEDVEKIPQAVMDALKKSLKPKQFKRLQQIQLQLRGAAAFQDAKVQKALKLSEDQVKELKNIQKDADKEMRELRAGGFNREMFTKMAKIRAQTLKKSIGVLKADQKKKWKTLTGEPFEMKFDRPGGRRGRGGRGGRQNQ
jgi:hypothetical protein